MESTSKPQPHTASSVEEEDSLTPEARARVDQLMHDLRNKPAIECPITFNWSGNQDLAEKAGLEIRLAGLLMREEWPSMSFAALSGITFHHDYELALKEAVGPESDAPRPTREAGGFSVGMMVRVGKSVQLVMHESVALSLVSDDPAVSDWAQHIVRHELCHVADYAFKRELIERYPDRCSYSGFDAFMAPSAEAMWDEFYANKYSFGPWADAQIFLNLLRDAVVAIHAEVVDAILEYRMSPDLEKLRVIVEPKIKFVAQCFGYAAGSLAGKGATLEQEASEVAELLTRLGLRDAWNTCFAMLAELDARRPDWGSVLDLTELFPGCVQIFAGFGLHYSPQGEGAYIDIPDTQYTNLTQVMLKRFGLK
ncbi:MAG: hypothetical protein ACT6RO_19575 [Hydrogenophaga sp.]|uniref:hypothetical protein n=1 Tax=Hydrogenophaga sp. TaxID=1904254 RepID=UPI0040353BBE